MKTITKNRLKKILISLIKKIDQEASNIRVIKNNDYTNLIKVDYIYKDQPTLNKLDVVWCSFGTRDNRLFYDVSGYQGRHYFGEQDYSADMQIAWSYVQQELARYNSHSESYYGFDGTMEMIGDGELYGINLKENVFLRQPSEAVRKAYNNAFYNDYPELKNINKMKG